MVYRLCSIGCGRYIIRFNTIRLVRTSAVVLASHHDEPPPVYIPKPAIGERNWLGSLKKPSERYPHEPYKPKKGDIYSFLGAGLGVILTLLAIVYYTDLFGKNVMKKDHGLKLRAHGSEKVHSTKNESESAEQVGSKSAFEEEAQREREKADTHTPHTHVMTSSSGNDEECCETHEEHRTHSKTEHAKHSSSEDKVSPHDDKPSAQAKQTSPSRELLPRELDKSKDEKCTVTTAGVEVPKFVEYLLVGAGAAAYYASLAIRARHANAKVLMIGDEQHLPYNRPPLSKELWWFGDENTAENLRYVGFSGKKRDIFFESAGFFVPPSELPSTVHGGVSLLKGHRVKMICPEEKKACLDDGTCIWYDKCLIATGGKPKSLSEFDEVSEDVKSKILHLHGVNDFRKLDSVCKSSKSIVIVGGGFIGSELAYSIRRKYEDIKITQVIAETGNLSGILPEFLSKKASNALRGIGVDVLTSTKVTGVQKDGEQLHLEVNGSKFITCDYIVVAVGIEPDTSVAEASGLEIDRHLGGVSTDAQLRVRPDIWAAGDAASFHDNSLGRRRVEHWEHAQVSGRLAGENMTGAEKAFWYQPAFYSKIAPNWNINAVGIVDSSLPTVSVFAKDDNANEEYERGVVFYKGEEGKVVGVLLLNVQGSGIDVSRRLIEEAKSIEDFRQLAKLYPLYKPDEPDEEKGSTTVEEKGTAKTE